MKIIPLKVKEPIKPGEKIVPIILDTIKLYNINIKDGDILAIALKVISVSKKAFIETGCTPTKKILDISKKYGLDPCITNEIISSKPIILGGSKGVIATIYRGILIGNIGIDRKNTCGELATRWPQDIEDEAHKIRREIFRETGINLGIIIVDSRVEPLRRGTRGFAVSISGFEAYRSYIGDKDLYGREIKYTVQNIADEIASAAHLYMGEGRERIPFVYIKNPPIIQSECASINDIKVPVEKCIYFGGLLKNRHEYNAG